MDHQEFAEFAESMRTEIGAIIQQFARIYAELPAAVIIAAPDSVRHYRARRRGKVNAGENYIATLGRDADTSRMGDVGAKIRAIIEEDPDAVAFVVSLGTVTEVAAGVASVSMTPAEYKAIAARAVEVRRWRDGNGAS